MQIPKRLILRHCEAWIYDSNKKFPSKQSCLSAQNLIEFIFVFPILIFTTLIIFEVALFWQDVNAIYNLNSEINANMAILNGYSNLQLTTGVCPAADETKPDSAISLLKNKDSIISLSKNTTYIHDTANEDGQAPFRLYKFISTNTVNANGQAKPQIALWVDCRNPFENGITTQIEFYHKTMVMKASIPRFDKPEPIVIIPDNIFIASPKLNTIRHY